MNVCSVIQPVAHVHGGVIRIAVFRDNLRVHSAGRVQASGFCTAEKVIKMLMIKAPNVIWICMSF